MTHEGTEAVPRAVWMVLNGDQLEVYDLNNANTVMILQFVPDRPREGAVMA
jgi:hypothetical protein